MESTLKIQNKQTILSLLQTIYKRIYSETKDSLTLLIIKGTNQKGYLTINKYLNFQYSVSFETNIEDKIVLEVNLKDFIKALLLQKTKIIIFSFSESEIYFNIPYGHIKIKRQFNNSQIDKLDSAIKASFEINKESFQESINFCSYFKSDNLIDDGKDDLCFNYTFRFTKNEFLVYTTNRHLMSRYKLILSKTSKLDTSFDIAFIISCLVIQVLLEFSFEIEESNINFKFTENMVLINLGDLSFLINIVKNDFGFDNLLPQKIKLILPLKSEQIQEIQTMYNYSDFLKWGEATKVKYDQEDSILLFERTHSYDDLQDKWTYYQKLAFPTNERVYNNFECKYMESYLSLSFNKLDSKFPCKVIVDSQKDYLVLFQQIPEGTKTILVMPIRS